MVPPIYVDLQATQNPSHFGRGIARYTIELTLSMMRAGLPVEEVALSPYLPQPELPDELARSPLLVTRTAATLASAADRGPFVYQLTSPMELELPPARTIPSSALERADALVAVLYDLIPLLFPDHYLVSPRSRECYRARLGLLRDADLILALSEHTRLDAIVHLGVPPERVVVIGGGASEFFKVPEPDDDPEGLLRVEHPEIRTPFVLTVAAWEWRKNLETLIRAMALLPASIRDDAQLVVVCSGLPPGERSWEQAAAAAGLRPGSFIVIGPVDDRVLRALYQTTSLFVFPSRYEGFGLPVVEAIRCGAAVITSSTSSLPEILDLPASTFPPDDAGVMASSIERSLTDSAFRTALLEAGARAAGHHTWDAVGRRVAEAYEQLAPVGSPMRPFTGSTRVAFVGCPATAARIFADPFGALRDEVGELALHVFDVAHAHRGAAVLSEGVARYPFEALDAHLDPYDYDVFVYSAAACLGDTRVTRLASRHPGVVWFEQSDLSLDRGCGPAAAALARGAHHLAVESSGTLAALRVLNEGAPLPPAWIPEASSGETLVGVIRRVARGDYASPGSANPRPGEARASGRC